MSLTARLGWGVALNTVVLSAFGQPPVPLADPVEKPLLPSGISELPLTLAAQRAHLFEEDDGTDVVHLVGEFLGTLGTAPAQTIRSQEAIAWVTPRWHNQRQYLHLQLFLWRDAEVLELSGTVSRAQMLFVTLDTFGVLNTNVDDFVHESSTNSPVYQEGNRIRAALALMVGEQKELPMCVLDPSSLGAAPGRPTPRPKLRFSADGEFKMDRLVGGEQIATVIGGVYLSRDAGGEEDFLEIQADAVVVFFSPSAPALLPANGGTGLGPVPKDESSSKVAGETPGAERGERRAPGDRQLLSAGFGEAEVEGAYLEGDVRMAQGPNTIRASRIYYDFGRDRAIILDAVVRATLVDRNVPLYVRAEEIRQLSATQFTADDAILTTSEFHTPHYHIGASRVEVINRTPAGTGGRPIGIRAGSFRIHDATLNVGGYPVAYWPFLWGTVDRSETAIEGVRTGYSDDFGLELETSWHLFNLLGLEKPEGFDSTLSLDYFSERGPAVGVDAKYHRDTYFGSLKSYLIWDEGEDFLGQDREESSADGARGRLLLRHRQYLEDDWEVSLELSYVSDKNFLEEFFETEFDNDKEQETLLYAKKQRDNWALTGLLQWRILDFTTQTERLPDWSFHVVGEPLGEGATWYSENRAGLVRFKAGDQTFQEFLRNGALESSDTTLRADTRQEVSRAFDLGPVRMVPFSMVRGTAWDDSPDEGALARAFGSVGVRSSMYLSRVYPNVRSELLDIDGFRHVIKPDITVWGSAANYDSNDLYAFDETVEGIDDIDGVTVGVRRRWQTKRGAGDNRRTVDVLTGDLDVGAFNDAPGDAITNGYASYTQPENSIARNFVNSSFIYRVNDRTAVLSETNYDLNDGKAAIYNVSVAVERTPRFSYLVGYRFIEKSDSDVLGFNLNYRLTEKHTLALREMFDLDEGQNLDFTVVLIRKFPRWFSALSFEVDESEDDFGVSLSIWPEGLPQAALGSRRFTGLANTTRIVPE